MTPVGKHLVKFETGAFVCVYIFRVFSAAYDGTEGYFSSGCRPLYSGIGL